MRFREILKIYRRVENLHPIATDICASSEFEQMFWNCLTHDLHVIRRRSQNLADGEITPVQKAFRILMEDKADGIAAIEIYMDDILGLKIVPEADRATTLAQALQTRNYVLNCMSNIYSCYGLPGVTHTNVMAVTQRVAGQIEPVIYGCLPGSISAIKLQHPT